MSAHTRIQICVWSFVVVEGKMIKNKSILSNVSSALKYLSDILDANSLAKGLLNDF